MKLFLTLPRLFRFILIFLLSLTSLFVVMRIAFYVVFNDPESPLIMADLIKSMWLGMRFDLRMVVLMLLPLFFLGGVKWISPFNYKSARYAWLAYLSTLFSVYVMFYVFDFGHYAYLNTRLDFTAMRFVENMAISAEMVWESYPVIPINHCDCIYEPYFYIPNEQAFCKNIQARERSIWLEKRRGVWLLWLLGPACAWLQQVFSVSTALE